jgi:hypothetical protein
MARIRVLRLIEYSYESAEIMAHDMARWTLQYSAPDRRIQIKSATLPPDIIKELPIRRNHNVDCPTSPGDGSCTCGFAEEKAAAKARGEAWAR